jgi:hypothetical protein
MDEDHTLECAVAQVGEDSWRKVAVLVSIQSPECCLGRFMNFDRSEPILSSPMFLCDTKYNNHKYTRRQRAAIAQIPDKGESTAAAGESAPPFADATDRVLIGIPSLFTGCYGS